MVHRIQNRNPGYSDFSSINGSTSFNFSNANLNPVSHGATALKLENEVVSENPVKESIDEVNNSYHEEFLKDQEAQNIIENTSSKDEVSFSQEAINNFSDNKNSLSNDLKEFGVDTNEPDLFNSESENSGTENLLSESDDNEEDDLEIPAFLRRQKN